jgi:Valyl tRNA synthetase tRNA binding arm
VRNAPPEVVETERARLAELERTVTSLTAQLERIRRLFKPPSDPE